MNPRDRDSSKWREFECFSKTACYSGCR